MLLIVNKIYVRLGLMEISFLGKDKFLIKTKRAKVVVENQEVKIETEEGEAITIKGPGEYEVKEVTVLGIKLAELDKTIYVLSLDDVRIAYLGEIDKKLTDGQVDLLDGVDVLLAPINGIEAIKQISPAIVVPMQYSDQKELDAFIKTIGFQARTEAKLSVSKLDLKEETELVVLEVKK